jgi:Tfp pilus assembly protein PilZ
MQPERKNKRYKIDSMGMKSRMVLAKYVKILNMSIGGVALQTDKRMTVGSQYTLKIESKGKTLNVKGVVLWSVLGESIRDTRDNIIPIYTAGMKFIDISPEKTGEIVNFIEAHKRDIDKEIDLYSPSGLRLHVRIHIEDPERAFLDFQEGHQVKNLSLGGMLIESEHGILGHAAERQKNIKGISPVTQFAANTLRLTLGLYPACKNVYKCK